MVLLLRCNYVWIIYLFQCFRLRKLNQRGNFISGLQPNRVGNHMSIDRVLFRDLASQHEDFGVEERASSIFSFFSLGGPGTRKCRDELNSLANQIFDLIEKKQSEGRSVVKMKSSASPEKQEQFIFSFLKKNYRVIAEVEGGTSERVGVKRARPDEVTDDLFKEFFGVDDLSMLKRPEARVWKLNWSDNPALLKNPKPKPVMPEPEYSRVPSRADAELHRQRVRNELCDVTFAIGDNNFPVHRIILANRSPYFSRMLQSGMKESKAHEIFEIKETTPRCFETFLTAIYRQHPPQRELPLEQLIELTNYADLTEVQFLFTWCLVALSKALRADTYYQIAMLANKLNNKSLIDYCSYFLSQNEKALAEVEFDLSELGIDELVEYLALGLNIGPNSLVVSCSNRLKYVFALDQENFANVCTRAIAAKGELAKSLKTLCAEYATAHRQEFERPDMKETKELYKRLMSGLD